MPAGLEEPVISADKGKQTVPGAGDSVKGKKLASFPPTHLDGRLIEVLPCHLRDVCNPQSGLRVLEFRELDAHFTAHIEEDP